MQLEKKTKYRRIHAGAGAGAGLYLYEGLLKRRLREIILLRYQPAPAVCPNALACFYTCYIILQVLLSRETLYCVGTGNLLAVWSRLRRSCAGPPQPVTDETGPRAERLSSPGEEIIGIVLRLELNFCWHWNCIESQLFIQKEMWWDIDGWQRRVCLRKNKKAYYAETVTRVELGCRWICHAALTEYRNEI